MGKAAPKPSPPDPERVRLLLGDPALVDGQLEKIQNEWLGKTPMFGALDVLYGDKVDIEEISTAIRTVSMTGRRLIVLRMADRMKDDLQRDVLELCGTISEDTRLLLLAQAPDLRRSLFAALKKANCIETVGPQQKDMRKALPEWKDLLRKLCKEKSLRLESEAAEAVLGHVIGDTGRLANELEKLSLRFGDQPVTHEQALLSLGGDKARTAFALSGALRDRRMGRALVELRTALAQGVATEVVIGELAGEVRALLRARALLDQGLSEAEAKKAFGGGRGFFVVPKARNYRSLELQRILQELSRIDVRSKRGIPASPPLEYLFLTIGQRKLLAESGS